MRRYDNRRIRINEMVDGQRERVYIYLDKHDKAYFKKEAKQQGISLSRYIVNLMREQTKRDLV